MCFEPSARPPEPPRTRRRTSSDRLTLKAADGCSFAATAARTSVDAAPGVVLLHDIRGLHPYYEHLADAFAEAGVHGLAIWTRADVEQEIVVYDGAPHGFFDRAMDEHAQACDAAWFRILRFMGVPPQRD